MKLHVFIYIILGFTFSLNALAQDELDSLKTMLSREKTDTSRIKLLNELAYQYRDINADSGLNYCKIAMAAAEQMEWKPGLFEANLYSGMNLTRLDKYADALKYFENALQIANELGDKQKIAKATGNIGNAYKLLADYPKALSAYEQVRIYYEQIGDSSSAGVAIGNLAMVYEELGDYKKSMQYYQMEMVIQEKTDNKKRIAKDLMGIADNYGYLGDPKKAIEFNQRALKINEEIGNNYAIASCVGNIGIIEADLGNFKTAIDYERKAIELCEKINHQYGKAVNLRALGNAYILAEDAVLTSFGIKPSLKYSKAIEMIKQSIQIATEIESLILAEESWADLAKIYEKQNNFKEAFQAYKQYSLLHDSILNDDKKEELIRKESQYDFEKKELKLKADQEKQNALAQGEIKNQKYQKRSILASSAALFIVGLALFQFRRSSQKIERQNALLQQRNEIRQRITLDLHDEIGSGLTAISMLCSKGMADLKKKELIDGSLLNSISGKSLLLSESLSDLIWTTQPENDNLDSLFTKIRTFSYGFLENTEIKLKLTIADSIKSIPTRPETNRNIYLILKEGLNNVVKHSQATEVGIEFTVNNQDFCLVIQDNGKGFDTALPTNRNGRKSMEMRARSIPGGKFEINSGPDSGTRLCLSGKFI